VAVKKSAHPARNLLDAVGPQAVALQSPSLRLIWPQRRPNRTESPDDRDPPVDRRDPHAYDALYCDLWGCLHDGQRAYPAAVAALERFRAKGGSVALVTNSPRPARDVVAATRRHRRPARRATT
jgi:beta-phosphoglucomutase-like phosphatase (HAD superfamily)